MDVITTFAGWRSALRDARSFERSIGFVPTMGALHRGHTALVRRARSDCDVVGVSIFVNPLQFGVVSDLVAYPRSLDGDCAILKTAGCDLVFAPSVEEMYPMFPVAPTTTISVHGAAAGLEGADRPGHFNGVATVVAMLFEMTEPSVAYFGEKDFQQLCVVRQMVRDLKMPVAVVGCATEREADGLALSSRNRRLSSEGRNAATIFWRGLGVGAEALRKGANPASIEAVMAQTIEQEPMAMLRYAVVADPITLSRPDSIQLGVDYRLLVAGEIEGVRLIDNIAACRDAIS